MKTSDLERDLRSLGVTFTTSPFECRFYANDAVTLPRWTKILFRSTPIGVVKPESTEEVCDLMRLCFERGIPVVPRGAGTSGLFGAVPKKGGIVLDLRGLASFVHIDKVQETVEVDGGITCWELDRKLREEGLALRSYPSSALSATLGGWIMGSGLGIGSLAYGPVSGHLLSGEAVLADGSARLFTAEEDLEWLWGSEGTLAVVTRVSLKARKAPESVSHHLLYFDDSSRLFGFVRAVVDSTALPYAVEFLDASYLSLLESVRHEVASFSAGGGTVLVTYEGERNAVEDGKEAVRRLASRFKGEMREGAEDQWKERFKMLRVKRALPTMLPIGVHVPVDRLGEFFRVAPRGRKRGLSFLGQVVAPTDCMVIAMAGTDERRLIEHTLSLHQPHGLFRISSSLGGKPGGGIGVWNAPYKRMITGSDRLGMMRRKKWELDPKGILNPGMGLTGSSVLFRPAPFRAAMALLSAVDRLLPRAALRREERFLDRELRACVDCGYCATSCPTRGDWVSSTPRGRVHLMKDFSRSPSTGSLSLQDSARTVFSCTLCGRCSVDCSVAIDSPTMWVEARRRLAAKGLEPDSLRALAGVIKETNNIAGKANSQRQQWAARLPEYGEISKKKKAEAVYFVGCVTSFYPTVQDVARSFSRTLALAKVDFMLLGGNERCCGYPLISAGRLDEAVSQMEQNIEAVRETGADTLLVTCPGCYRMWKHEYERLTGIHPGVSVLHSTEFLWQLIEKGAVRLGKSSGLITYHDPCDLGRVSGIFDAPRDIINSVGGITYVELEGNREYSVCCGSGGDLLASDQDLSLTIARKRLDQVRQTGADTLVTACPSCVRGMIMARMAAKRQLNILDITQLVWKAIEKPGD